MAGLAIGVLLILIIASVVMHFGGFSLVRNPQIGYSQLFYALVPFLAVSVGEELLFRGYPFQRAIRGIGSNYALLIFGLFFALVHWANPGMDGAARIWGSLNIGLAAILLGLAYIKTQSLALPIGVHLGWNWSQGGLLGFGVSGNEYSGFWEPVFNDSPNWLTGGDFGLEASLIATAVCLAACVALALWKRRG
jgi:membrane protease YdiL (CAAX protease family)